MSEREYRIVSYREGWLWTAIPQSKDRLQWFAVSALRRPFGVEVWGLTRKQAHRRAQRAIDADKRSRQRAARRNAKRSATYRATPQNGESDE